MSLKFRGLTNIQENISSDSSTLLSSSQWPVTPIQGTWCSLLASLGIRTHSTYTCRDIHTETHPLLWEFLMTYLDCIYSHSSSLLFQNPLLLLLLLLSPLEVKWSNSLFLCKTFYYIYWFYVCIYRCIYHGKCEVIKRQLWELVLWFWYVNLRDQT